MRVDHVLWFIYFLCGVLIICESHTVHLLAISIALIGTIYIILAINYLQWKKRNT